MYVAWYIGFATLTWKWPLKKQIISAVFARYNMWRLVGLNIFHLLILHSGRSLEHDYADIYFWNCLYSQKIEFDSVTIKNWVSTGSKFKVKFLQSDNAAGDAGTENFLLGDDEHLEDRLTEVISSDYLQSWFSSAFTVQTWLCCQHHHQERI